MNFICDHLPENICAIIVYDYATNLQQAIRMREGRGTGKAQRNFEKGTG